MKFPKTTFKPYINVYKGIHAYRNDVEGINCVSKSMSFGRVDNPVKLLLMFQVNNIKATRIQKIGSTRTCVL